MKKYKWLFFLMVILVGCQQTENPTTTSATNEESVIVPIQYAKNFTIEKFETYTKLTVQNPWKGATESFEYIAYPRETEPPKGYEKAHLIPVPVQSIACLSTTHVALLDFLEETDKIIGISGANYVYNPAVLEQVNNKVIKELGDESGLNYEILLDAEPEIVLTYGIGGALNNIDKLDKLNLTPIVVAEYIDNSPLARAEWVKFFAVLVGKEAEANQKFEEIATEYEALKIQTKDLDKPTVFMGTPYEGTWFMPGGQSFVGQFTADAGGDYLWKSSKEKGSLELDFEAVYENAQAAAVWLDLGMVTSLKQMEGMDSRFKEFTAFQNKNIFNYTKRLSPNGGYDIYESAVVNPHLVLKDFIKILHPEVLEAHELVYYEVLE